MDATCLHEPDETHSFAGLRRVRSSTSAPASCATLMGRAITVLATLSLGIDSSRSSGSVCILRPRHSSLAATVATCAASRRNHAWDSILDTAWVLLGVRFRLIA